MAGFFLIVVSDCVRCVFRAFKHDIKDICTDRFSGLGGLLSDCGGFCRLTGNLQRKAPNAGRIARPVYRGLAANRPAAFSFNVVAHKTNAIKSVNKPPENRQTAIIIFVIFCI